MSLEDLGIVIQCGEFLLSVGVEVVWGGTLCTEMFSWSWDSSFWRFVTEVESSVVSTGGGEGWKGHVFGGLAIAFGPFRGRSWSWRSEKSIGVVVFFRTRIEIDVNVNKYLNLDSLLQTLNASVP
jgi:hypothetical protein